jgi:hypothetical protein
MTNHIPNESETFIQHYGKKKKAFRIISWKDEYKRRRKNESNKSRC